MSYLSQIFTFLVLIIIPWTSGYTKTNPQPIWNSTFTDKLRQDLLLNYDKFARPSQHYNATLVRFGLSILHIEVNEFKSTFTVYSWIRLMWDDEKLKWNSSDYGGIHNLHMADHEVWQPDIFVYNSATSSAISHYGNTHCIIYENGQVLWVPPTQFSVLCDFNLKYWPFDSHQCAIKFGSWTYSGEQIDLQIMDNETEAKLELLLPNAEWKLVSTNVQRNLKYYDCCAEPYPDITINVAINRNSTSYKALIITPAIVIILLVLMGFWLPPQASEKIMLNGCTAIIICLFLLYFTQRVPIMGSHTPLIVLFYSSSLYIVALSLVTSVIVIWLSRTRHTCALPWIIKQPLTGTLGKFLGLQPYIFQTAKGASQEQFECSNRRASNDEFRNQQASDCEETASTGDEHHIIRNTTEYSKSSLQYDWILLAAAIDRICFCFFCLLFLLLSIVYSL